MRVTLIPILTDNYAYLVEGGAPETAAIVDPGEAEPVIRELERRGLKLSLILCTHHHGDHVGGAAELKSRYGCPVIGPERDRARLPALDRGVEDGDEFDLGGEPVRVIATPGHTANHVCYYLPQSGILFSGDTLFSMGCGRLFEGTADEMWDSLQKLASLPPETNIYCGHEYTLANAVFCKHAEPDNPALARRHEDVKALRAEGKPTLPVALETELRTNVFLHAGSAKRFGELRRLKDTF